MRRSWTEISLDLDSWATARQMLRH